MNEMDVLKDLFRRSRERTLGLLQKIEAEPDAQAVLAWRPGPGRAHIGWQLMHVAMTEELAATERLFPGVKPAWPDLVQRFRGGSTPDDNVPTAQQIRDYLAKAREHLDAAMSKVAGDLDTVPASLKERNWTIRDLLATYLWHEGHHQGQAHLTYNLYKAQKGLG
jgi:hypothetical protein